MSIRIAGLALAALLTGCGEIGSEEVEDAWVRLPAVAGRPGAAYFHMRTGKDPLTIVKVSTPIALRAEMHESMKGDHGMMSMAPIAQVAVPAASGVDFAPGGKHVMLFDVSPALKVGATAPLMLHLANGDTMTLKAIVVGAGDPAPPQEGRQS